MNTQKMIALPFPHIVIDDFLPSAQLQDLAQHIVQLPYQEKKNDLYHFFQSADFANFAQLQTFCTTITQELRPMLSAMTNITLNTTLDIHATCYQDTHHLLPHDDRLSSRKIAFMLYLSTLTARQGGALILHGNPTKSIQPKLNRLVCFMVSKKSIHSVSEVLNAQRFTVGGWFHG